MSKKALTYPVPYFLGGSRRDFGDGGKKLKKIIKEGTMVGGVFSLAFSTTRTCMLVERRGGHTGSVSMRFTCLPPFWSRFICGLYQNI